MASTPAPYRRRRSESASYFDVLCSENRREQKHLFVGSRAAHLVTALIEALANAGGERDFGQL